MRVSNCFFLLILFTLLVFPQQKFKTGVYANLASELNSRQNLWQVKNLGANSVIHHSRTDASHSKDSLEFYGFDDVIIFNAYNAQDYIHHYSGGYYTRWEAENNTPVGGVTPGVKYEFGTDSGTSWKSELYSYNIGKYLVTGPDYIQDRKYKFYYDTSTISYSVNFCLRIDGSLTAGDSVCEISVKYRTVDNKDTVLVKKKLFDYDLSNSYDTIRLHYSIPEKIYGTSTEIPPGIVSGGFEKYGDALMIDPYNGPYGVQFNVKWLGNRNLYIDYIEVYDDYVWGEYLFYPTLVVQRITNYASTNKTNNIKYWYSLDEPMSIDNYEPYKVVEAILKNNDQAPLITAFYPAWDGIRNHEFTIKRFLETVQPDRLMYDYYPYYYGDDYPDETCLQQQHNLMQEPFITSYGFPPIGDYYYVVQSFGYTPECSTDVYHQSRKPNSKQLRASVMLALAHGTKGIFFWPYYSYNSTSECGTILTDAIVDINNNPTELYYEIKNNIFLRLNGSLGNMLIKLNYNGHNIKVTQSDHSDNSEDFLTIQDYETDYNWHAGFLIDKTDQENEHFLLVNLRTDTIRTAKLLITNNSGYSNLRVKNIEDSSLDTTVTAATCTLYQTLQAGDGKLYQVAPVVKYGGKIKTSETINQPIALLGELTVEAGATLTINANYDIYKNITVNAGGTIEVSAGKQLKFYDGASLIANGTLTATGTSSDKITFDFISINTSLQNGIKVNPGGNLNVSQSIVKNAYRGIYINEATASIDESEFLGCQTGIYLYRTNFTLDDPYITNNYIHNSTGGGITNYYSSPYLTGNEVSYNYTGVGASSTSSPYLGYAGAYGNNNVHHNYRGIHAISYSNPFLGRATCTLQGGNNIIENNTSQNILAQNNCNIIAENNWWGSDPPNLSKIVASTGSTIDYTPWLRSPPNQQLANRSNSPEEFLYDQNFCTLQSNEEFPSTEGSTVYNFNPDWPIFWKLLYARNLIDVRNYKFAQQILKQVITANPDSSLSLYAVDLLWRASRKFDVDSLKLFLNNLSNRSGKKDIYAQAQLILAGYENTNRIKKLDEVMIKYPKTTFAEMALFQKFLYYFNERNDLVKAREVANQMDANFPNSELTKDAHDHFSDPGFSPKIIADPSEKDNSKILQADRSIPTEYELVGNYPNPFNPSTTISYALPFESEVVITIFDLTGSIVKSYILNNQLAGYKDLLWDGRNNYGAEVSSGVYIYSIKAVSLEENGKSFAKSSKLMLLK